MDRTASNGKSKLENVPIYEDETIYQVEGRVTWSLRKKDWLRDLVLLLCLLTFLSFAFLAFVSHMTGQLQSLKAEIRDLRQELDEVKQRLDGSVSTFHGDVAEGVRNRMKRLAALQPSMDDMKRGKPRSGSSKKASRARLNKSRSSKPKNMGGIGVRALHLQGERSQIKTEADGLVRHWAVKNPAPWTAFQLNNTHLEDEDGRVVVGESGLYFMYAQLYYPGAGNENSFEICVMEERVGFKPSPVAQCSITKHSGDHNDVTCYTAVVQVLEAGDKVYVRQKERYRDIVTEEGHSFLGLVKLA